MENILIKYNNTLENYNKKFILYVRMKPDMEASLFINNLRDDIETHIDIIIKKEKEVLNKNCSKNKIKSMKKYIKDNNAIEDHFIFIKEILDYLDKNDIIFNNEKKDQVIVNYLKIQKN